MATATVERVTVRPGDKERFAARPPLPPPGDVYQPLLHEPPPHGETAPTTEELQRRTLLSSGINLSKAIMGVGILALPRVFSLLGIGTATLWLVFIALLSYASMHMLTKATARTGLASYSDLVKDRLGLFAQTIHDLSIIANCFGMMVVYLVIIGDVLVGEGKAEGLLSEDCGDRRTVLAVVTLLLLAPLVSATRTRATVGASALGVVAILIWAAITLLLFLLAASNGQLHTMHWWPSSATFKSKGFESAVQMVGVLPILVVAYLCHMSLGHTSREVAYASERQLDNVSVVAVSLSTVAFLVISVCSYGIFGAKGLKADVLSSFTVKALQPIVWTRLAQACFMLVRLGFLVSLLAMFPLQMAPFRDSLWNLLFRQELQGPGLWLVTYIVLFGVYWAAAYITSIWGPLIVLGSTAGVLIAFVLPGLLSTRLEEELSESRAARRSRMLGGWLLALVGLVIGTAGIVRVLFYRDPISD